MTFPSCRQHERTALNKLMTSLELVDAWKVLNAQSQGNRGYTWHQSDKDGRMKSLTTDGGSCRMRIDLMLLPRQWFSDTAVAKVTSCTVSQKPHRSDHLPLQCRLVKQAHSAETTKRIRDAVITRLSLLREQERMATGSQEECKELPNVKTTPRRCQPHARIPQGTCERMVDIFKTAVRIHDIFEGKKSTCKPRNRSRTCHCGEWN